MSGFYLPFELNCHSLVKNTLTFKQSMFAMSECKVFQPNLVVTVIVLTGTIGQLICKVCA